MTAVLTAPDARPEPPGHVEATSAERFPFRVVALAMGISIALRARFITTPLTSDEGGYLAVARAWASGRRLYTQTWVDRPQGLLVLYRAWDDLTGGSGPAIRIMAIIFGCVAVAAVAYIAFALAGPRAAAAAAVLVAIASANARIEGFIANGELLAGGTGAAGVAMACAHLFRGHSRRWLFGAGVVAGVAISFKQSGCDGFLAVLVCILASRAGRAGAWRQVRHQLAAYVGGAALVLAALVVHGALTGFRAWWYAVAGYRTQGINATSRADWHRFGMTGMIAAPTIIPLVGVALAGSLVWIANSRRRSPSTVLVPAWICFAIVTFLAGGLFHRHYWVTLTFPLATATGIALSRLRHRQVVAVATCLVALPSLISSAEVITMDRGQATLVASGDPRSTTNQIVADWYERNRTPTSSIYALCASAGLYASADAIPPYPYLWQDGVLNGKGAQDDLVRLLAGRDAPTFVVEYQSAGTCNPSGQVARLLDERYTFVTTVQGLQILRLAPAAALATAPPPPFERSGPA